MKMRGITTEFGSILCQAFRGKSNLKWVGGACDAKYAKWIHNEPLTRVTLLNYKRGDGAEGVSDENW